MSQSLSINKDGTISVYIGGRRQWSGPVAELVAYLTSPEAALPAPKKRREKPKSRAARWADAAGAAVAAITTLQELQGEFSDWKDNLPENLQQSALGEKLDAVVDLDIDGALETIEEAEGIDLPLGFGRN